jgi:hypothetical protein
VVVLGAVGFLLLRPDKAPVESPKPPPVVQVPVVATPVATPKPPDPAPVAPTPVAPTPTANPAPGPAPEVHAAVAEKRKTLEKRMETLRRQYEALVARVGVDQLQPMATAAYDEARSEFKKNIGNPRTYGDMEQTLKDAESYLSKERRRLGQ